MSSWNVLDIKLLNHGLDEFYIKLLEHADTAIENYQNYFNNKNKQVINTYFLNKKTINARAKLENKEYHIGIHSALPCILHFTFNLLLRTPNYFGDIGKIEDIDEYRQFPNGIPLILPNDVPIEEALWGIVATSRPSSDCRAEAATLLTEIAMIFCSYHELAHIQTGHVLSARELFGESEYLEFFGQKSLFSNRKIIRIWEYEADKIATIMIAGNDMLDKRNQEYFSETFKIDLDKDLYKLFGVILSSLFVLFHLLSQNYSKFEFLSNHPHPAIRYSYVSSEIVNFISRYLKHNIDEKKEFKKKMGDFVFMTQRAWTDLGLPLSKDMTQSKSIEWTLKETDKLENNRNKYKHLYSNRAWVYPFS